MLLLFSHSLQFAALSFTAGTFRHVLLYPDPIYRSSFLGGNHPGNRWTLLGLIRLEQLHLESL